jgi:hypothetical protein
MAKRKGPNRENKIGISATFDDEVECNLD